MIILTRYSYATVYFQLFGENEVPFNLTGYGIKFVVKNKTVDTALFSMTLGNGIQAIEPSVGSFAVYFNSTHTKNICGDYSCSIFICPNGTNFGTIGSPIPIYCIYNDTLRIIDAVNPY